LNRKPTLFNFCGAAANSPRCRHPRRPARHAGGGWAAGVARSNGACQNLPIPAPNRGARRDRPNTGSGDPQPRWPWTRKPETARLSRANGRERGRTGPVFSQVAASAGEGGRGTHRVRPQPRDEAGGPAPRPERKPGQWIGLGQSRAATTGEPKRSACGTHLLLIPHSPGRAAMTRSRHATGGRGRAHEQIAQLKNPHPQRRNPSASRVLCRATPRAGGRGKAGTVPYAGKPHLSAAGRSDIFGVDAAGSSRRP
jgi:hypothetical protein